jgi:hypothetical protein
VTLLGQPIHRVTELGVDPDPTQASASSWVDTGSTPPSPCPRFCALTLPPASIGGTAANVTSPWLFPDLLPGEHRSSRQVGDVLRASGEIETADITNDENGERIKLVLRVNPKKLEFLPEHRPREVELSKITLARVRTADAETVSTGPG